MSTTGERLRELRQAAEMSRPQLARRIYVSTATVTSWEMDKNIPRLDNAAVLADLFGVTLDYIAGRENPQQRSPE